jgi:CRP-like cAMP-binding protein
LRWSWGLLRTFVLAADGRQITLRYSRPGALVGAASLYAENIAFVQMQALVDTRLLLLRPPQVRALALSQPSVANLLLLELGERTAAYMNMIAATGRALCGRGVHQLPGRGGRRAGPVLFEDSAWRRLVELKRQWDPDNVFRLNHNIPPL